MDDASSYSVKGISIHAPREGGDLTRFVPTRVTDIISIHAPREGGDNTIDSNFAQIVISIHAPREGGDGVL